MSADRKFSLLERAQQTLEKAQSQDATVQTLLSMDKEIEGVEKIIDTASKSVSLRVKDNLGEELQEMKVQKLSSMLEDEDLRGKYLFKKQPQLKSMAAQITEIQPDGQGKTELNKLVKQVIMNGFLEGAALTESGNPDIGNLRIPKVLSKKTTDLLIGLRRVIVEKEAECIGKAIRFVGRMRDPRQLQSFVLDAVNLGWINSPLVKTERGNVDFSKVEAPRVANSRVQSSYHGIAMFIQKKGEQLLS